LLSFPLPHGEWAFVFLTFLQVTSVINQAQDSPQVRSVSHWGLRLRVCVDARGASRGVRIAVIVTESSQAKHPEFLGEEKSEIRCPGRHF
jgi:hypothetical protein